MEAWRDVLRLWLRARIRKTRVNRDLDDEFRFHLDQHADALVDNGMPAKEADDFAREQLGDLNALKQRTRAAADEGSRLALDEWRLLTMMPRSVNFKVLVTTLVILGAAGGYVFGRLQKPLYRAEARLMVAPAGVAMDIVQAAPNSLESRLEFIQLMVLSQTRLERLVTNFNLYPSTAAMVDRVKALRSHIVFTPEGLAGRIFTIRFTGTDPTTVMKVTEHLAETFKGEGMNGEARLWESTNSFLEARAEDVGNRLTAHLAAAKTAGTLTEPRVKLETEVLQATYTRLLTSLEDARGRVNMARRMISEQLNLLDQARIPERPITPTALEQAGVGALAGLALAVVIAVVVLGVRLWRRRPPAASVAELA